MSSNNQIREVKTYFGYKEKKNSPFEFSDYINDHEPSCMIVMAKRDDVANISEKNDFFIKDWFRSLIGETNFGAETWIVLSRISDHGNLVVDGPFEYAGEAFEFAMQNLGITDLFSVKPAITIT